MSFLLIKVGRDNTNDIQVDDERVSEKHLELFRDVEMNVYLTDLNSKHGTYVNQTKIDDAVLLQKGDEVKLANSLNLDWEGIIQKASESSFTVGSNIANRIQLEGSSIDDFHLILYKDLKGITFVNDLKSVNGTFINGHRIQGIALLQKGDRLKIGKTLYDWEHLFEKGELIEFIEKIEKPIPEKPRKESVSTSDSIVKEVEKAKPIKSIITQKTPVNYRAWLKVLLIFVIDLLLLFWLMQII